MTTLLQRSLRSFASTLGGQFATESPGQLLRIIHSRDNTHRIIRKFNSELDSPYLTHRVLNTPPAEAEAHTLPLIASELLDILQDCGIDKLVSLNYIDTWVKYQIKQGLSFAGKFGALSHPEVHQLVRILLKDGVENKSTFETTKNAWDSQIKKFNNSKKDADSFLTQLFTLPTAKNVKDRDLDFAILTTIRSKYSSPAPILTLGTIVCKGSRTSRQYYVCMYTACL